MKKIFLSVLILAMSMILFSPNVHAEGDPGFTVYAFDGTETTHDITYNEGDYARIFIDGNIVYDGFITNNTPHTNGLYSILFYITFGFNVLYDGDDLVDITPSNITFEAEVTMYVIISESPDDYRAWSYNGLSAEHEIDTLDLNRTLFYISNSLIYDKGVTLDSDYTIFDNRLTYNTITIESPTEVQIWYDFYNGQMSNEISTTLVVEVAEPTYDPIYTLEQVIGTYDFNQSPETYGTLEVEGLYRISDIDILALDGQPFIVNGEISDNNQTSGFNLENVFIEDGIIKYDGEPVVDLIWVTPGKLHINGLLANTSWPWDDAVDNMPTVITYIYRVPGFTGTSAFITNVDNPIAEGQIRASLAAFDETDGDITSSIVKESDTYTPNMNTVGTYTIVYSVTDSSDNTVEFTVTVLVKDIEKPVIDLDGNDEVTISYTETGFDYNDLFTASDNYYDLEDLTITVDDDDFSLAVGEYTIIITAADPSGNTSTAEITITVIDDVVPVITGPDEFTTTISSGLTLGTILTQYTAEDEINGSRTNYITVLSNTFTANKNVAGVYEIVIKVADLSGNIGTKTIEVTVTDDVVPVFYITRAFISVAESITLTLEDIIRVLYITGQIDSIEGYTLVSSTYFGNELEEGIYSVKLTNGVNELTTFINVDASAPVIFAIQFNSSGGSFVSNIFVNRNQTATQPENPVREGFKFDGWYRDSLYITRMEWNNALTDDIILYAKWVPVQAQNNYAVQIAMYSAMGLIIIGLAIFIKKKAR